MTSFDMKFAMKNKEFQFVINGKRQSISVSALTMQFVSSDEQFQNVARAAVELFWDCCHWGETEQPKSFDDQVSWLCSNYEVSVPELLRTCIAWRDGYLEHSRD